ncbi:anthranilate phosphoribosyltransferase [Parasulfuritortus cantonensis]|uniref:Anthranilate phosphoribosyltransferase n=1 Tax=Parasulfuritortus cantonensis TaxID=2528202 RepID=A0A4V2NX37_9PROT|nr:anthranilate phosphoribosyltransferase [Parasulfuritortus cantonensis]TCJ19782.1 anthranilate phosphoribosyltransferase [Parasulfuritortus cantonensis]
MNQAALDPQKVMHSIIQRIATGPELSKNISREEAAIGMQAILDGDVDPVQAAIFFIALRMKRETMDEFKGILDAILASTERIVAEVDDVVDIADPYDGYNRCLPAAPFLPVLLAELGVAAVNHGLEAVGPKYGVTARHVLRAAGVDVDLGPVEAAARLADPAKGWAYVDQSRFCPRLHDLLPLRQRMIKRQAVTTVETEAMPIAGRKHTHFVTGYVHKPYPPIYAQLARHAGFDSALIIRGVEGGIMPSLRQAGKYSAYQNKAEEVEFDIDPAALGISQSVRAVALPDDLPKSEREGDEVAIMVDVQATARAAAEAGLEALAGNKGATYDTLVLTAALVMHHLGRAKSLPEGADMARAALDSGKALARVK